MANVKIKESIAVIGKYSGEVHVTIPTGRRFHLFNTETKYNLLTDNGRTWFLNRFIANAADFVKAIAIGTGTTPPQLDQSALVTETAREPSTNSIKGKPDWQAIFTSDFEAVQINGTTEIAVLNDSVAGTMICRNVHTAYQVPPGSGITLNYIFEITTSKTVSGWTQTTGLSGTGSTTVYEIPDSVLTGCVLETDTGNGYAKKTSISSVQSTPGSYWHDTNTNKTYIHCTDGANPSTHNIVVISGA